MLRLFLLLTVKEERGKLNIYEKERRNGKWKEFKRHLEEHGGCCL